MQCRRHLSCRHRKMCRLRVVHLHLFCLYSLNLAEFAFVLTARPLFACCRNPQPLSRISEFGFWKKWEFVIPTAEKNDILSLCDNASCKLAFIDAAKLQIRQNLVVFHIKAKGSTQQNHHLFGFLASR